MTAIDCAREVLKNGCQVVRQRKDNPREYDCKPYFTGNKRGWVAVDSFSASAIVKVWEALTPQNRELFERLRIDKMAKVAFKFVR